MSRMNLTNRQFDEGRLMNVLIAPIVSEKATMVAEKSNVVTFKVLQDATKHEIMAAVQLMFNVEVKGSRFSTPRVKPSVLASPWAAATTFARPM